MRCGRARRWSTGSDWSSPLSVAASQAPNDRVSPPRAVWRRAAVLLVAAGCTTEDPSPQEPQGVLDVEALMDPRTCEGCHPVQYAEWASSMHAYASEDPLFVAMNSRGVEDAKIGEFCVNCHAPMAVRTGATTDGSNLAELPRHLQGVTCYYCHNVQDVTGDHNNPLVLADDTVMRGAFDDPLPTPAHGSAYSEFVDRDRFESSRLCGACHDIVNGNGVHLERTFGEWKDSVYSTAVGGTTCGQCHMDQSLKEAKVANVADAPTRRVHSHLLPGVDLALTPFPDKALQREAVQKQLDNTLQTALCVRGVGAAAQLELIIDNVGAGHSFPSGATQDRRAWVEVVAYDDDDAVIYESGVVPEGSSVSELDDPDLWLMGDCMFDDSGAPVHMFWEATDNVSRLLPAQATFDVSDPRYYQSHLFRTYPSDAPLGQMPARVVARVWLQPFELMVFDELVDAGDLVDGDDWSVAEVRNALAPLQIGTDLVWTAESANETFTDRLLPVSCISETKLTANSDKVAAKSLVGCSL